MTKMTSTQMEQTTGGDCLVWAAIGGVLGAEGGPLGVLGGAYLGYTACEFFTS